MKKKHAIVIAILAATSVILGFADNPNALHIGEENAVSEEIKICEEIEHNDGIGEEIELGDTSEIPLETGARVIIECPNGNVYEFLGEEYDIADNRITVYFEPDFIS